MKAGDIDATLKYERPNENRQMTTAAQLGTLPDGVLVKHIESENFYLLLDGSAYVWSFSGYGTREGLQALSGDFRVMTPASTVAALKNGYRAEIHVSAVS